MSEHYIKEYPTVVVTNPLLNRAQPSSVTGVNGLSY